MMSEKQTKANTVIEMNHCGDKTAAMPHSKIDRESTKKQLNYGIFLKALVTVAVIAVLIIVVYVAVERSKHCSHAVPRNYSKPVLPGVRAKSLKQKNTDDCLEGSIEQSHAHFTFLPSSSAKPYQTNGIEFSFGEIIKKVGRNTITEFNHELAGTFRIHYYLNIDRCRIGGGVQLNEEPYIRGPLAFAINHECSKVYFFSSTTQRWIKYNSATKLTCSHHGAGFCTSGALTTQNWLFSEPENQITGLEFDFNVLSAKFQKYNWDIKTLLLANKPVVHYIVNMKACLSSDFASSVLPLLLAVDQNCSKSYVFNNVDSTWKRQEKTKLFCPWKNHTWCENGSLNKSLASFQFKASSDGQHVQVVGIEYTFVALLRKLRGLITDTATITEIHNNNKDARYYLNSKRCENGGLSNIARSPSARGPLYFAVTKNCSFVHYFSPSTHGWKTYQSASRIFCQ